MTNRIRFGNLVFKAVVRSFSFIYSIDLTAKGSYPFKGVAQLWESGLYLTLNSQHNLPEVNTNGAHIGLSD
jgi:hypothetical protein